MNNENADFKYNESTISSAEGILLLRIIDCMAFLIVSW